MKAIKMMIYGDPGTGKSVFACHAPRPFFITTDGNYEWLEDFGAKPEDHIQVYSWEQAKQAFTENYDNYDTIVVDLVEDLFKWCEQEYCVRSKLDHVSDVGYGKGYDITRSEFFLEISKLLGKPKHVILISHGITFETKDRRGVPHVKHAPSSRIPDRLMDMIEGRLRYCLRCYTKATETEEGSIIKTRWLSLVPKENEFGIIRGVDESTIPQDIPLDWSEFAKAIKLNYTKPIQTVVTEINTVKTENTTVRPVDMSKLVIKDTSTDISHIDTTEQHIEDMSVNVVNDRQQDSKVNTDTDTKTDVKIQTSTSDKLAAIKAKLEALKNANK